MRRVLLLLALSMVFGGCSSKPEAQCKKFRKLMGKLAAAMPMEKCLEDMKKEAAAKPEEHACAMKCLDAATELSGFVACSGKCKAPTAPKGTAADREQRITTACWQKCRDKYKDAPKTGDKQRACNIRCRKANGLSH